eukprot:TRINITY_DN1116_c0_g1_i1.p1 TRINITY_DN1116_c0_g1~~TRINITY_DN1116_c0_g1_i1.p1  ORF type:complete len:382 (+),score=61.43 TRINITY_DN1116_c0_g1_i1:206-1351(+)
MDPRFIEKGIGIILGFASLYFGYRALKILQEVANPPPLKDASAIAKVRKAIQSNRALRVRSDYQQVTEIQLNTYEIKLANCIVDTSSLETGFNEIGGLEDIKKEIYRLLILPFVRPELFRADSISKPPKGILFYGPPGNGKTLIAKACAKEAGVSFIEVHSDSLFDKYLGETEKMVSALFTLARKIQPCIVFVDEIDSLLRERGNSNHEVYDRVKTQFMSFWDGMESKSDDNIIFIGTTNRKDTLDSAIQRRLPFQFYIGPPNASQREQILRVILRRENLDPSFSYSEVARKTEEYSGSDLKELCRRAAIIPITEHIENNPINNNDTDPSTFTHSSLRSLTNADFETARSKVGPTNSSRGNVYDFTAFLRGLSPDNSGNSV